MGPENSMRPLGVKAIVVLALHLAPVIMALVTAVAALNLPFTEGQPTKDAGIYAPLMALCAALMLLLNSLDANGPKWRQVTRNSFAAIFSAVSAYFWIAGAIERHPLDRDVWYGFGLVWGLVVAFALLAALIIGLTLATKDN